ncbi:MAG: hypothetical protein ACKN9T_07405, partial [Candidatus Methylumidiphilus sp.]
DAAANFKNHRLSNFPKTRIHIFLITARFKEKKSIGEILRRKNYSSGQAHISGNEPCKSGAASSRPTDRQNCRAIK